MKVAILGRPNVGKSTLFNRLVGKAAAIVDDTPGVTRDWQVQPARIADLRFNLVDTAGLAGFEADDLINQIRSYVEQLTHRLDVILFMVDGRDGLLPDDLEILRTLQKRQIRAPIIPVINKCEGREQLGSVGEFYQLGLGDPVAISAEHGLGMDELYQRLQAYQIDSIEEVHHPVAGNAQEDQSSDTPEKPLRLAVIGRPNAGKSTLINALIGEERFLTGELAGLTRDAIAVEWHYKSRAIKLFDTAGVRRRARVQAGLEKKSIDETLRAIRFADMTILVTDVSRAFDKQDLTLAQLVIREGRNLVIAVNKMDLGTPSHLQALRAQLDHVLAQVKGVPFVGISALKKKKLGALMDAVLTQDRLWNTRISTAVLNDWLREVTQQHPPPLLAGRRLKLKYMTQVKTRPPTFSLFMTRASELPEAYKRYLVNQLRQEFSLPGVTIRLHARSGHNPYAGNNRN